eukprot:24906-Eustigmatos_ZCMA.PRE.1
MDDDQVRQLPIAVRLRMRRGTTFVSHKGSRGDSLFLLRLLGQVMDEVIRLLWDAEAEDDTVMQDVMSSPELTNNTNTVYGVNVA